MVWRAASTRPRCSWGVEAEEVLPEAPVEGGVYRPTTAGSVAEDLYEKLEPLAYDDANVGWALLHLCAALGNPAQQLHDLISEDDEGHPGWSALLDPDACPPVALPWLAQLVGERFVPGTSESAQRAQISGLWNWARGSVDAVRHAVGRSLTGSKEVRIYERTDSAYHYTVHVHPNECPDPGQAERDARASKPAGLILDFVVADWAIVDGLGETEIDDLTGTINELDQV